MRTNTGVRYKTGFVEVASPQKEERNISKSDPCFFLGQAN